MSRVTCQVSGVTWHLQLANRKRVVNCEQENAHKKCLMSAYMGINLGDIFFMCNKYMTVQLNCYIHSAKTIAKYMIYNICFCCLATRFLRSTWHPNALALDPEPWNGHLLADIMKNHGGHSVPSWKLSNFPGFSLSLSKKKFLKQNYAIQWFYEECARHRSSNVILWIN